MGAAAGQVTIVLRTRERRPREVIIVVTAPTTTTGLDVESLVFTLESIGDFAQRELPEALLLELDERDEFPERLVRRMCGEELGVQLVFVPEEHGGMGGSAFDVYRVCERMAAIDVGLATSVLATFLGSDPIRVGGTPEQRAQWLGRIAAGRHPHGLRRDGA